MVKSKQDKHFEIAAYIILSIIMLVIFFPPAAVYVIHNGRKFPSDQWIFYFSKRNQFRSLFLYLGIQSNNT